jgi:hypothetical protein
VIIIPLKYGKGAKIKILLTKKDGSTQHYWVSLERFLDMKEKGMDVKPLSKTTRRTITGKIPIDYEIDFINNFVEFGGAGLKIGENTYKAELIAEVKITKNDKPIRMLKLNVNREKLARIILEFLLKGKK